MMPLPKSIIIILYNNNKLLLFGVGYFAFNFTPYRLTEEKKITQYRNIKDIKNKYISTYAI